MRLTKGIYCRRVKTAFGYYTPDKETLFCKQLLRKENEIIGYETGLSALNRIGLVSQMPKGDALQPTCIQNEFPKECRLRFGNRLL